MDYGKRSADFKGFTKNHWSLKISSEIERVADFAVNIAKATIKIGQTESLLELTEIEKMKELSIEMLRKALQSFFDENMVLAKEVGDLEDEVDQLSSETYKKLTDIFK